MRATTQVNIGPLTIVWKSEFCGPRQNSADYDRIYQPNNSTNLHEPLPGPQIGRHNHHHRYATYSVRLMAATHY